MRLINRLVWRPTVVKAMLCSFVLHVGSIYAAHAWWSDPVNHFSVAGQRSAIYVEAVFSENRPHESVETRLDVEPNAAAEMNATRVPAAEISPRELPLTRRETSIEIERFVARESIERVADVGEFAAHVSAPRRRATEPGHTVIESTEVSLRLPRREASPPLRQSMIAAQQVAGIDDETPPDFTGNRPPSYPLEAIRRGLEGTVVLRLHIANTGRVEQVEITKSSGHALLDRAAVAAVNTWRGQPAERSGHTVATVELLPIRFRLRR